MSEAVLDSSAVLALLFGEPGAEVVQTNLPGALISAVNLAEVMSKLCELGMAPGAAREAVAALGVDIVDFDAEQAGIVGDLRNVTRAAGLSLGDRACLALAIHLRLRAVTADRAWVNVPGIDVILIRPSP